MRVLVVPNMMAIVQLFGRPLTHKLKEPFRPPAPTPLSDRLTRTAPWLVEQRHIQGLSS